MALGKTPTAETAGSATASQGRKLALFVVALAMALGAYVRLSPVLAADLPLNDGGLFYTMTQDLLRARYLPPLYTTYNAANIPFAYPLLPFYVAALLADVTRWPLLDLFRLLPALISVLTIPAYYLLGRTLLHSRTQAALATFAFALFPRGFFRLIMGGGLTRSFGMLFALLTLHQVLLLYTRRQTKFIFATALFAALTILSHPEMAWFAAYSTALFFLFYGRNRFSLPASLAVAGGVLALTSPWWAMVLARHGIAPLLAVLQSGIHTPYAWLVLLLLFNFTSEPFASLQAVLGLLGLFVALARKKVLLPLWFVAILILDARGEATHVGIPLTMLVAIALDQMLLPALARLERGPPAQASVDRQLAAEQPSSFPKGILPKLALGFLLIQATISAWASTQPGWTLFYALGTEEQNAMQWASSHTAESSRFLIITGDAWWKDPSLEWFPSLARRVSVTTVQGTEWLSGRQFSLRSAQNDALQQCATQDSRCLEEWADQTGFSFTHVYIIAQPRPGAPVDLCLPLRNALQSAPAYTLCYDGPGAMIWEQTGVHGER